jgi:hypothetical protein
MKTGSSSCALASRCCRFLEALPCEIWRRVAESHTCHEQQGSMNVILAYISRVIQRISHSRVRDDYEDVGPSDIVTVLNSRVSNRNVSPHRAVFGTFRLVGVEVGMSRLWCARIWKAPRNKPSRACRQPVDRILLIQLNSTWQTTTSIVHALAFIFRTSYPSPSTLSYLRRFRNEQVSCQIRRR